MSLQIEQLNAYYGQAQALFALDLRVDPGEWVVLQGLNGAGKSTLLRAIMGLEVRTSGRVSWAGQAMDGWPPHRRAQHGVAYVPEDRRLFTGLSVRDNLMLAASSNRHLAEVLSLFPALKGMLHRPAAHMSGGEQQMLAIARALMTQPRLLLLDEPCEGIAPLLVADIAAALGALREQGITLLVAEQNQMVSRLADRVITLAGGRVAHVSTTPVRLPDSP